MGRGRGVGRRPAGRPGDVCGPGALSLKEGLRCRGSWEPVRSKVKARPGEADVGVYLKLAQRTRRGGLWLSAQAYPVMNEHKTSCVEWLGLMPDRASELTWRARCRGLVGFDLM